MLVALAEGDCNMRCSRLRGLPGIKRHFVTFCRFHLLHVVATLIVLYQSPASGQDQPKRPATVTDLVSMVKPGDPIYDATFLGKDIADKIALFSPNQEKFIVLLKKGVIQNNTNQYSILLWRTAEVFTTPTPDVVVTLSSSSNEPAIAGLQWLDNDTIAFIGKQPGEPAQAFTLNLRERVPKKLTNHPTNLVWFGVDRSGRHVSYIAENPAQTLFNDITKRRGLVVSDEPIEELITGKSAAGVGYRHLFIQNNGSPAREVPIPVDAYDSISNPPIVSPNGKQVAVLGVPVEIPGAWTEYKDTNIQKEATRKFSLHERTHLKQWIVVNMDTGASRVLLNAPVLDSDCNLMWSPTSDSVIITNTNLPLEGTSAQEREARKSTTLTVEVDIATGTISKITDSVLRSTTVEASPTGLVLRSRNDDPKTTEREMTFRKIGNSWERTDVTIKNTTPRVVLKEDMNTPERIVAIDPSTNRERLLLDLNPQFKDLIFGRVEEIHWKTADGRDKKGGLYYPVHYIPGKRYPLVIQTHGWSSDRFLIDGSFPTAFAAQALAGKGIMVLQEEIDIVDVAGATKEGPAEEASYEGAVDYLDGIGLIDRNQVGLVGFSRTCFHVKYTLTHSKYHFAAASVTDGIDAGYMQYMVRAVTNGSFVDDLAELNGAPPFGKGLQKWLERSPGFNIDKVQTPVLIVALAPDNVVGEWEWLAALHQLHKPVEMIEMMDGEHLLKKPWERLISLQGTVDWFAFWLKGEKDPDPTKTSQYERWRQLRDLQSSSQKVSTTNAWKEQN
jgi:dipeptidyl aminopeptidase/acylaminoacyl peptidase